MSFEELQEKVSDFKGPTHIEAHPSIR